MDHSELKEQSDANFEKMMKKYGGIEACQKAADEMRIKMLASGMIDEDGEIVKGRVENGMVSPHTNPIVMLMAAGQMAKSIIEDAPPLMIPDAIAAFFTGFGGTVVKAGSADEYEAEGVINKTPIH